MGCAHRGVVDYAALVPWIAVGAVVADLAWRVFSGFSHRSFDDLRNLQDAAEAASKVKSPAEHVFNALIYERLYRRHHRGDSIWFLYFWWSVGGLAAFFGFMAEMPRPIPPSLYLVSIGAMWPLSFFVGATYHRWAESTVSRADDVNERLWSAMVHEREAFLRETSLNAKIRVPKAPWNLAIRFLRPRRRRPSPDSSSAAAPPAVTK